MRTLVGVIILSWYTLVFGWRSITFKGFGTNLKNDLCKINRPLCHKLNCQITSFNLGINRINRPKSLMINFYENLKSKFKSLTSQKNVELSKYYGPELTYVTPAIKKIMECGIPLENLTLRDIEKVADDLNMPETYLGEYFTFLFQEVVWSVITNDDNMNDLKAVHSFITRNNLTKLEIGNGLSLVAIRIAEKVPKDSSGFSNYDVARSYHLYIVKVMYLMDNLIGLHGYYGDRVLTAFSFCTLDEYYETISHLLRHHFSTSILDIMMSHVPNRTTSQHEITDLYQFLNVSYHPQVFSRQDMDALVNSTFQEGISFVMKAVDFDSLLTSHHTHTNDNLLKSEVEFVQQAYSLFNGTKEQLMQMVDQYTIPVFSTYCSKVVDDICALYHDTGEESKSNDCTAPTPTPSDNSIKTDSKARAMIPNLAIKKNKKKNSKKEIKLNDADFSLVDNYHNKLQNLQLQLELSSDKIMPVIHRSISLKCDELFNNLIRIMFVTKDESIESKALAHQLARAVKDYLTKISRLRNLTGSYYKSEPKFTFPVLPSLSIDTVMSSLKSTESYAISFDPQSIQRHINRLYKSYLTMSESVPREAETDGTTDDYLKFMQSLFDGMSQDARSALTESIGLQMLQEFVTNCVRPAGVDGITSMNDVSKNYYQTSLLQAYEIPSSKFKAFSERFYYNYVLELLNTTSWPSDVELDKMGQLELFLDVSPHFVRLVRLAQLGPTFVKLAKQCVLGNSVKSHYRMSISPSDILMLQKTSERLNFSHQDSFDLLSVATKDFLQNYIDSVLLKLWNARPDVIAHESESSNINLMSTKVNLFRTKLMTTIVDLMGDACKNYENLLNISLVHFDGNDTHSAGNIRSSEQLQHRMISISRFIPTSPQDAEDLSSIYDFYLTSLLSLDKSLPLYQKSVLYETLVGHLLHIPEKDMLAKKNKVVHQAVEEALVSYERTLLQDSQSDIEVKRSFQDQLKRIQDMLHLNSTEMSISILNTTSNYFGSKLKDILLASLDEARGDDVSRADIGDMFYAWRNQMNQLGIKLTAMDVVSAGLFGSGRENLMKKLKAFIVPVFLVEAWSLIACGKDYNIDNLYEFYLTPNVDFDKRSSDIMLRDIYCSHVHTMVNDALNFSKYYRMEDCNSCIRNLINAKNELKYFDRYVSTPHVVNKAKYTYGNWVPTVGNKYLVTFSSKVKVAIYDDEDRNRLLSSLEGFDKSEIHFLTNFIQLGDPTPPPELDSEIKERNERLVQDEGEVEDYLQYFPLDYFPTVQDVFDENDVTDEEMASLTNEEPEVTAYSPNHGREPLTGVRAMSNAKGKARYDNEYMNVNEEQHIPYDFFAYDDMKGENSLRPLGEAGDSEYFVHQEKEDDVGDSAEDQDNSILDFEEDLD